MAGRHETSTERASDRELVVTRRFDAPTRLVWDAWTRPELFRRWWLPASFGMTMVAYEADIRAGGGYSLTISHPDHPQPMTFHGRYLEATPPSRLVWTNEEADGGSVTTVTFEEQDGATLVTVSELYPSKEALDEAMASGSASGWPVQFDQLDELLAAGDALTTDE